jgi:alkylation response protein AidB-like acyl-CoA dehydrogenase
VDFQLTEDQEALQQGLRVFCEGQVPVERLAELEQKRAFDRGLWKELAEMGVFALRLPEEEGGVGLGYADAVLVFEELGRRAVPGPLAWSHLAAGLVEGAATGDTVVGGLDMIGPDRDPIVVEHLESIDELIVLQESGVYRIDPAAISGEPVAIPLDPLTPIHLVAELPQGDRIADAEAASRLRLEGAALVSGQMLGIAEATLELAVPYSLQREQFGRPIGGFQALKHIMADMFVKQEVARAAVYAAGATLDDPRVGDVVRAVSTAKVVAGEAALRNARSCIQVHGGMGYTWEVPAHYYLKRTWVLENVFGTVDEHSEQVARRVELGT